MSQPGRAGAPAGRLRVGLIGAGRIVSEYHLAAYLRCRDILEIRAVADPDPASRDGVAAALGIPHRRRHADLTGLLSQDDLEVVVIASPPAAHREAVAAALARGVGVICEKPLGLDLAELASLRDPGTTSGFIAIVHNYSTKPGWQHLIELVGLGRIGRPLLVRFEELADDHWRLAGASAGSWRQRPEQGGGPLRDNLYHALYLAEQILGSQLERASGEQAALGHDYPAGDAAMITARHRDGTLSQATAAWCYLGSSRATAEVLGTAGVLRYRYWSEPDRLRIESGDGPGELVPVPQWSQELESGYVTFFRQTADRFLRGLPPLFGVADAERITRAIEQVPFMGKEASDDLASGSTRNG